MTPLKTPPLKTITVGALAAFTLTLTAHALPKADTDQDGQVSQSEFMAKSDERFRLTDSNHDGLLSQEERSAAHDAMRGEKKAEQFTRLDTNGDGVLSQTEFMTPPTRPERTKPAGSDAAEEGKPRGFGRRGMRHKGGQRDGSMRGGPMKSHWKKADADNDGFISRAEYDAQAAAIFEKLDRNNDGVLTKDDHGRRGKRTQK